jgi:hypothetical protein
MQVATYLHRGFHDFYRRSRLPDSKELVGAFDVAIAQTRKCLEAGMTTSNGESARRHLEVLQQELEREREHAVEAGAVDREWLQKTVRALVEWVPETELTLIAALGIIARVPRSTS